MRRDGLLPAAAESFVSGMTRLLIIPERDEAARRYLGLTG
jgi:hypothetical protein